MLFLCTGNSACSILAEAYLHHRGRGGLHAYSAGSYPTGRVDQMVLGNLPCCAIPVSDRRSKSWDEFVGPAAPQLDFVFTVCDRTTGEICPIWPGPACDWSLGQATQRPFKTMNPRRSGPSRSRSEVSSVASICSCLFQSAARTECRCASVYARSASADKKLKKNAVTDDQRLTEASRELPGR